MVPVVVAVAVAALVVAVVAAVAVMTVAARGRAVRDAATPRGPYINEDECFF